MDKAIKILLVEDDADDVDLLQEALRDNNVTFSIDVIKDGGLVQGYLEKCTVLPDVIVLDFNLPRVHGRELLKLFKNTPVFKNIPVIILTTSCAQTDIDFAQREGAEKFLTKPTTNQGINTVISVIINAAKKSGQ